jgi:glycosyltransferase involved in cell wall biosynthesis
MAALLDRHDGEMRLTVIIPAYNSRAFLHQALQALAVSCRPPDEVIVVDDGSTDGTGTLAQSLGAHVIRLPDGPRGPARARNRGAAEASGDLLVFLDADVAAHPDTLTRMEARFREQPDLAALFGSYDADPPSPGYVSRFRNLLHHFTHQTSAREACTFWSGCGAIRRETFVALGGFDESYRSPAVEDIELGMRLRQTGQHILLDPDLQVTHLKVWTFASLLFSDIFGRAVPWTRLIMQQDRLPRTLNLSLNSRVSALLAWGELVLFGLGFWSPAAWLGFLLVLGLQVLLNRQLYLLFADKGPLAFLLTAVGMHHLYLLYSSLTFGIFYGAHLLEKWSGWGRLRRIDQPWGRASHHEKGNLQQPNP